MTAAEAFNRDAAVYDRVRWQAVPCYEDFYGAAIELIASRVGYSSPRSRKNHTKMFHVRHCGMIDRQEKHTFARHEDCLLGGIFCPVRELAGFGGAYSKDGIELWPAHVAKITSHARA